MQMPDPYMRLVGAASNRALQAHKKSPGYAGIVFLSKHL